MAHLVTSYRTTVFTYEGSINRISGVAGWTRYRANDGVNVQTIHFNGRCRLGTQTCSMPIGSSRQRLSRPVVLGAIEDSVFQEDEIELLGRDAARLRKEAA